MQAYTAKLEKRPGIFAQQVMQLPLSITLTPRKWSGADVGRPEAATIDATGTPEDLAYLLTWLGDRSVIYNEMGSPVWWGVVYEIEANFGGITVSLSLETIFNRVKVIYSFTLPDGTTESGESAWAEDTASINRYGRREKLHSMPDADADKAVAARDKLLRQFADPAPVITTQASNKFGATLHCRGQWALLDFVYWTNPKGMKDYEGFGGGTQAIGASYTANTISFGTLAAGLPPDDDGKDDISDAANGFGTLVQGTIFRVRGAAVAANNGVFTVQALQVATGTDRVETVENSQVAEAAGANVTITLGEFGMVGWVAQNFTVSEGWMPTRIALRVQRVGNPTDNLTYRIKANDSGIPASGEVGTLAFGSIAGSSVPASMNWTEIPITPQDIEVGAGVTL